MDLEARVDQALGGAEPQAPAPAPAAEQRLSETDKAYSPAGAAAKEPAAPDIALRCATASPKGVCITLWHGPLVGLQETHLRGKHECACSHTHATLQVEGVRHIRV